MAAEATRSRSARGMTGRSYWLGCSNCSLASFRGRDWGQWLNRGLRLRMWLRLSLLHRGRFLLEKVSHASDLGPRVSRRPDRAWTCLLAYRMHVGMRWGSCWFRIMSTAPAWISWRPYIRPETWDFKSTSRFAEERKSKEVVLTVRYSLQERIWRHQQQQSEISGHIWESHATNDVPATMQACTPLYIQSIVNTSMIVLMVICGFPCCREGCLTITAHFETRYSRAKSGSPYRLSILMLRLLYNSIPRASLCSWFLLCQVVPVTSFAASGGCRTPARSLCAWRMFYLATGVRNVAKTRRRTQLWLTGLCHAVELDFYTCRLFCRVRTMWSRACTWMKETHLLANEPLCWFP